jgi:hypothetical protein
MEADKKIRAILTGATGMVGEGVLHESLNHPMVEAILVIGRKPCGVSHPRLREILLPDISRLESVEGQLSGYNACFFCAGVSSVGMKEEKFEELTYQLTMGFAKTLARINPGMTFCYVSGAGTDSSEKGRLMWARVKGKTENDLQKLGFRREYNFRPGYMHPTKGLRYTNPYYKYLTWMYPALRKIFPNRVTTLAEMGKAMIRTALAGYDKNTIEVKDILALAREKD